MAKSIQSLRTASVSDGKDTGDIDHSEHMHPMGGVVPNFWWKYRSVLRLIRSIILLRLTTNHFLAKSYERLPPSSLASCCSLFSVPGLIAKSFCRPSPVSLPLKKGLVFSCSPNFPQVLIYPSSHTCRSISDGQSVI